LATDNFDVGTRGATHARRQPIGPPALAIAVVIGFLVALEVVRPVHAVDAGVRAAVETAIAVAGLLASRLLIDIFDRTRQLRELLLAVGVFALSLAAFSYWVGPIVAGVRDPASGDAVRLGWELIGALALAAAALVPPTSLVAPFRRLANATAVLGLGVIAVGTLLAAVLAVHPATGRANAAAPSLMVGVQVASVVILAVAGCAFVAGAWRAERGTELLAGACMLLAVAGGQFVTVSPGPTDWVTPGDGARLVAFGLLLGAMCLRYRKVQRHHAHRAVCSERERIARDLHDGLAQDLACITTQAQRFDCRLGPDHPLILATRDALGELRGMIADLTDSTAAPAEEAAPPIAHELGHLFDTHGDPPSRTGSEPTVDHPTPQTRARSVALQNSRVRRMSRFSRERPLRGKQRRGA
jgi:hypothetical protein